ncbi:MAG TPA: phospholipase D-like domain-containing protein [Bacteroidota bacterium]|nr:phospholipase D-like domain-containing protein [Bacteroidota bacterium]
MKKFWYSLTLVLLPTLYAQSVPPPELELGESIPVGTALGNPEIRSAHDVWVEMIGRAERSIDIEEFYIANEPNEPMQDVLNAICAAADRGVTIRILADARMYQTYPISIDTLGRHRHITTRLIDFGKLTGGIQHAKYFLIDGMDTYVGSQNFDWRSLKHIHELGFRIHNKQIAAMYEDIFDFDWELASGVESIKILRPKFSQPYPLPIHLAVQNGDSASIIPTFSPIGLIPDSTLWDETVLVRLIDEAQHSLTLQFLTYSPLEHHGKEYSVIDHAIRRAAQRGVKVKMIVADWEKSSSAVRSLKELSALPNIEVAFTAIPEWSGGYVSFARVEHCKYVVADSATFWLGTSNCEKSYFYASRNLGIAGANKFLAMQLSNIFYQSWNSPYKEFVTPNGTYFPRDHGEKK